MKHRLHFIRALLTTSAIATCLALSPAAMATEITIQITNLTQGMSFTPRLVVAHNDEVDLFEAGTAASRPLAWMAEGGVIVNAQNSASSDSNFEWFLEASAQADNNTWKAFGLSASPLPPASSSMAYTFEREDYPLLSLVTMLIPSNDAFVGLDSWTIPTTPGTYHINLNAYDAGTEANDEISSLRTDVVEAETNNALGGYAVPGMAGSGNPNATNVGAGGTGVAIPVTSGTLADDGAEGHVHIHRGALGDTDPTGGVSDLDSRVHRWLNPVARLTVTVPGA